MGFFEKKHCSICDKEIGLLGTVKLEDGVICKNCSGKLSPFFTGRKKTTVNEIKQQLAYREKNEKEVATFNPDVIIGDKTKVYVESGSGTFAVSNFTDWRKHNPDLLTRAMVNACDIEVKEHKDEVYGEDAEGNKVSYDPPRYNFAYEFLAHILVNHPYFDEIKFELSDPNKRPASQDSTAYIETAAMGRKLQAALLPSKYTYVEGENDVVFSIDTGYSAGASEWKCSCGHLNREGKFCSKCGKPRPIRWYCPDCGKENHDMFCVACGRKRPE